MRPLNAEFTPSFSDRGNKIGVRGLQTGPDDRHLALRAPRFLTGPFSRPTLPNSNLPIIFPLTSPANVAPKGGAP